MKVVNLARRPFLNRRPVWRLAAFLWLLGLVLLVVNLWLFGSYWRGTAVNRARLDAQDREIEAEQERIDAAWRRLRDLDLRGRNDKARYLNRLIDRRVFPWSALFDHLEDVTPIDVYLVTVKPSVRFARDDAPARTGARVVTPQEARERARRQRLGDAPPEPEPAVDGGEEPRDRVSLTLRGVARTEEAMLELVDTLYRHPSFLDPNLSRESRKRGGNVEFNIRVVYLTPPGGRAADAVAEDAVAEGEAPVVAGGPDGETGAAGSEDEVAVAPERGEPTPGVSTPGESTPGESTPGESTPGVSTPGEPVRAEDEKAIARDRTPRDRRTPSRDRYRPEPYDEADPRRADPRRTEPRRTRPGRGDAPSTGDTTLTLPGTVGVPVQGTSGEGSSPGAAPPPTGEPGRAPQGLTPSASGTPRLRSSLDGAGLHELVLVAARLEETT